MTNNGPITNSNRVKLLKQIRGENANNKIEVTNVHSAWLRALQNGNLNNNSIRLRNAQSKMKNSENQQLKKNISLLRKIDVDVLIAYIKSSVVVKKGHDHEFVEELFDEILRRYANQQHKLFKKVRNNIVLAPPSAFHKNFPGGSRYHKAMNNFNKRR